jgi:sulfate transport system ATP-binding protein
VRPHDIDILLEPADGATEAMVERVVYLGFEVRVDLLRSDGQRVWVQVPRDLAERLELATGQIVYARSSGERVFTAA